MRAIITILLVCLFGTGCSAYRNIQICPQACKPVVDYHKPEHHGPVPEDSLAYYDRLHKQKVYYWLTDSEGRPVTSYRARRDSLFEFLPTSYWPITPTKDDPKQIAEMVTLGRRSTDVVFHLVYPNGHVDSIALRDATLEQHKDYEVLYVK